MTDEQKHENDADEALDTAIEATEEAAEAKAAADAANEAEAAANTDSENTDANDAADDADDADGADAKPHMPIGIVYDDEDQPGEPADAGDDVHRPALDQTDALIASFLGVDKSKVSAEATPASTEKPAEAAPVMVASKIDREITERDTTVFSSYPTVAFKHVTFTPRGRGASPVFDDALDMAFYDRRTYVVTVRSDAQRVALMSLLAGLVRPDSGHVMFKSKDIEEIGGNEYRSHFVGLMLQRNGLRDDLTALDNVVNAMDASGRNFLKPRRTIAEALLARVGFPSELAETTRLGGLPEIHRRRVAVAKALCCEPGAIIADDPVAGLDDPVRSEILGLLRDAARKENKTVIIVTEDAGLGASFADKTYTL